MHPISPKTPAPQYQPIYIKKRKENIVEDYRNDRAAYANKKSLALLLKPALLLKRGLQYHSRGTLRGEQKSFGTVRFCSDVAHKYTDVRPGHRVLPALAHTVQVAHH